MLPSSPGDLNSLTLFERMVIVWLLKLPPYDLRYVYEKCKIFNLQFECRKLGESTTRINVFTECFMVFNGETQRSFSPF